MLRISRARRGALLAVVSITSLAALGACHRGAAGAGTASARGAARPNMLVSTEWLASHANDKDLVILHVARRNQFDSGHVAGARHVTLADISLPAGPGKLSLQMPPVAELTTWARAQGITDRSRIVVVPHDDTLQSATRVFLTLAYLGTIDRTSLLDGGYKAWRSEGRAAVTTAPAAILPGAFTPKPQPALIATLAQVEAATQDGSLSIVDARLPRFYNGDGGGYPRAGHIPTAVNIPLTTVANDGHFKAPTELQRLFTTAGVSDGKPLVTYCHIGQQASLLWFVATMLGYDAAMFDGSFQEWSGTDRVPVVGPKK